MVFQAQLNNDYGRELLMQAIQGNRSAIDQIANALNCITTQLQSAICNVQGAIDKVAGQVGMTSQAVINAVQQQGCEIGNQIRLLLLQFEFFDQPKHLPDSADDQQSRL